MNQRKPSLLAQVAGEATITVEQAAEVLGLGRTAAYEPPGGATSPPAGSDGA